MADAVPKELKSVTPFVQRARELEGRDPVIQYYCLYHAANMAMNLSPTADDSRVFLLNLLDQLEALKSSLADQEAITNDIVAQAYLTNFAERVFSGADNEDRQGSATRATAKKFIAAANFLELLGDFTPLDEEIVERIKYSKWKATDIAKALKEGRQPTPGNGQEPPSDDQSHVDSVSQTLEQQNAEPEEVSTTQNIASSFSPDKTESEQEVELALLASQSAAAQSTSSPSNENPPLPEPSEDPLSQFPSAVLPSLPNDTSDPATTDATSPDLPHPSLTLSEVPSAPSLEVPPQSPERMQTPVGQQPPVLPRPTTPATQRTYHASPMVSAGSPPPPLPVSHPQPFAYEEPLAVLDPKVVAQTQKHAKFAISALNYDDVTEAKKQLRQALNLLGG